MAALIPAFSLFISMELTWKQFVNQNHICILNENQQVQEYRYYLDFLANQNFRQNKGTAISRQGPTVPYEGFLLQEDYDFLLQETGHRIFL